MADNKAYMVMDMEVDKPGAWRFAWWLTWWWTWMATDKVADDMADMAMDMEVDKAADEFADCYNSINYIISRKCENFYTNG